MGSFEWALKKKRQFLRLTGPTMHERSKANTSVGKENTEVAGRRFRGPDEDMRVTTALIPPLTHSAPEQRLLCYHG